MNNFKKPELIKIPISRLLKIEVPRFALRVIDIVEKHDPEELHINEIFNLLVAEQPNIEKLDDKPGPHPLTGEIVDLRVTRTLYLNSIKLQLRVVINEDKSKADKDVKMVSGSLNQFFANLELCKNDEMFIQKTTQFFESIDRNEELEIAFSKLDFTKHLNNFRSVHASIQEYLNDRLSSISQRHGASTPELKRSVIGAVVNLFKQIEIAILKNKDLDYAPLCNELNQLLIVYRDLINFRILYNKRKAERKKKGKTTVTATTAQLNETAGSMQSLSELGSQLAEMEKAVAMSSKTMQPPFDKKNEA